MTQEKARRVLEPRGKGHWLNRLAANGFVHGNGEFGAAGPSRQGVYAKADIVHNDSQEVQKNMGAGHGAPGNRRARLNGGLLGESK